jgi:hypothetical protein
MLKRMLHIELANGVSHIIPRNLSSRAQEGLSRKTAFTHNADRLERSRKFLTRRTVSV